MSLCFDAVNEASFLKRPMFGPPTLARAQRHHPDLSVVIARTSSSRVESAKCLMVDPETRDAGLVAYLRRRRPGHGMTESQPKVDAYVACVHLDEFSDYDVWCDERHEPSGPLRAGTVHVNDMRREWRADIRSSFHVMNFYIPQSQLDDIAEEFGASRIEEIKCPISQRRIDSVFNNLALALLPTLTKKDQTNRLFAEQILNAAKMHMVISYGATALKRPNVRGGLSPWQASRSKELLSADLSGNLRLRDLAKLCNISLSHFNHAFKITVGCPPHQWLLGYRIERAKHLLLNSEQSLAEIALSTGFSDQSHFTRVFSQRTKLAPAAWRRHQAR